MKYFLPGVFGLFFACVATVEAASLYIDPPQAELYRGDAIELTVRLDVDEAVGECVNAIDAVVKYPASVSPVDVAIGSSILRMWVEEPVIDPTTRTITFAGGIPNGYCGRVEGDPKLTNELMSVIVRSPAQAATSEATTADFVFADVSTVYLNDGLGTKARPSTFGTTLTLLPEAGEVIRDPWTEEVAADTIEPVPFSIELARDERAFSGQYYIAFSTTDKQTGIDHYEVLEQSLTESIFSWGDATAPWTIARSPHVLDDQTLNSSIFVKAVDKAGNEYIAKLVPDESLRTMRPISVMTLILYAGMFVLLAILGLIGWQLFGAFRRKTPSKLLHRANESLQKTHEAQTTPQQPEDKLDEEKTD